MAPDTEDSYTLEGAGSCPKCRYVLPRLVDCAPTYFETGYVVCKNCGEHVDLWQVALERAIRMRKAGASALVSFGAGQTSFVIQVQPGKYYEEDLAKRGVPSDARILRRIYTGQTGDVYVLEWHSNAPPLRFPGTTLRLLAIPVGEGPESGLGEVAVNIVWIREESSPEWTYLVTAFEAAAAGDYAPSLVFAQSAVEISLMPLIGARLRRHASAERVDRFMVDALTFNHALNVVLPYLCEECGASSLPEGIRGALNRLRKSRNDIIHKGTKSDAVTAAEAMEGLCAAAFGFEYIRYVTPKIQSKGTAVMP